MNPLWHTGVQHVHLRYNCNLAFQIWITLRYSEENVNAVQLEFVDFHTYETAGKIYSQHILQDMSLRAHSLQKYLMRRKYCSLCECTLPLNAVTPFGISSPAGREGTLSRPQQDAKFQYASTISTHLITRVNKREVDLYNCPLIGGGEIGLVKEI